MPNIPDVLIVLIFGLHCFAHVLINDLKTRLVRIEDIVEQIRTTQQTTPFDNDKHSTMWGDI